MTQTISRMYASKAQAAKAVEDLKKLGCNTVHLFSAPEPSGEMNGDGAKVHTPPPVAGIEAAMLKAHLLKHEAKVYAERVSKGAALVTAHALFGTALDVRDALDSHGPIDSGVPDVKDPAFLWDERTPMSSALRMRVLSEHSLPFERMWGVPSVTKGAAYFSSCLGMPMLSKPGTPFSSALGRNTLSSNKTPFSSRLGLPLLK
jgi:hypothetical protein